MSDRAARLLASMTTVEKIAQVGSVRFSQLTTGGDLDPKKIEQRLSSGIGFVARLGVESGYAPAAAARAGDVLQEFLATRTRLGIPAIVAEECLSGFCVEGATQFPQAIGLASTWDPKLVENVAAAIRTHMTAIGAHLAFGPVVDVARDSRWGRVEETFGEDPELASRIAVAYVRGLQEPSLRSGVAATAKHFIAHGASDGGINCAEVSMGPRRLRDVYAAPFRAVINEARVAAVMTAYHEIDGEPCTASRDLLQGLLRGELGFSGLVVSDFWAVHHLRTRHRVAETDAHAARQAVKAGVDVELPALDCFRNVESLIASGELDIRLLDDAVRRVLRLKFELGLLDGRAPGRPRIDLRSESDAALARRAAIRSLVLLTNDGTLPLATDELRTVAVIGPVADDPTILFGDYSYLHQRADFAVAPVCDAPSPMMGLRAALPAHVSLVHAAGAPLIGDEDAEQLVEACAVARDADVAVVFLGGRSGTGVESTSGEHRDASDTRLPRGQRRLVAAIAATGTPTVVVLVSGRPHALGEEFERVGATLLAWLPGDEGAHAIADVLCGTTAPGGRLPVSILRTSGQAGRHSGGHGREDREPLPFAFGHGLSFTTFRYDDLVVTATTTADPVVVSITVTNVGEHAGDEVVQVYSQRQVSSLARPERELVAFARVSLPPGEATEICFAIPAGRLGYTGRNGRFVVEPGAVTLLVGASSRDIRCRGRVLLGGGEACPDPNRVPPFSWTQSRLHTSHAARAESVRMPEVEPA